MTTLKTLAMLVLCGSFSLLAGCSTLAGVANSILMVEKEQATEPAAVAHTDATPESVKTVSEL